MLATAINTIAFRPIKVTTRPAAGRAIAVSIASTPAPCRGGRQPRGCRKRLRRPPSSIACSDRRQSTTRYARPAAAASSTPSATTPPVCVRTSARLRDEADGTGWELCGEMRRVTSRLETPAWARVAVARSCRGARVAGRRPRFARRRGRLQRSHAVPRASCRGGRRVSRRCCPW